MGIGQRMQAYSASHPFSINKKLDSYLSERLPELMDEYKLAQKRDLSGIEKDFEDKEKKMEELDAWKKDFEERALRNQKRVDRLKVKYSIKEDE